MNEERRRELGIPVHGDDEHEWRADGYCNCGAREKPERRPVSRTALTESGVRPKTNLDHIEQNQDNR